MINEVVKKVVGKTSCLSKKNIAEIAIGSGVAIIAFNTALLLKNMVEGKDRNNNKEGTGDYESGIPALIIHGCTTPTEYQKDEYERYNSERFLEYYRRYHDVNDFQLELGGKLCEIERRIDEAFNILYGADLSEIADEYYQGLDNEFENYSDEEDIEEDEE